MSWKVHENVLMIGNPAPRSVTWGGTVTAGQLVVQAGDDGKYDACGDNAVKINGIALTGGADTEAGQILPIYPHMILKAPYVGTYNVNLLGAFVGIDASQNVDLDNTTNKAFRLIEQLTGDDAGYCLVSIANGASVEAGGVEV